MRLRHRGLVSGRRRRRRRRSTSRCLGEKLQRGCDFAGTSLLIEGFSHTHETLSQNRFLQVNSQVTDVLNLVRISEEQNVQKVILYIQEWLTL